MIRTTFSALIVAGLMAAAPQAMAQTTVGIGDTGNCFPFSCNDSGKTSGESIDYFQIYSSSAFAGTTTFNTISFSDSGLGGTGDLIGGTYDISFSTTTSGLGSSYPIGPLANTVTFLDEQLAASSANNGLSLRGTPYVYNPADGNLVMEVSVSNQDGVRNQSTNAYLLADDSGTSATRAYFIMGNDTEPQSDTVALVTTFSSSASISGAPEPSTWALMLAGLGVLGGMLRLVAARRREQVVSA